MNQQHDEGYLRLLFNVYKHGVQKTDRTGTGTRSIFSRQLRFDLSDGTIPLLTTKKMHTKSIIHEILWYLSGNTNVKYLQDNGVRIWNEWADDNGDLGPVYGAMWRKWPVAAGAAIDWLTDPPTPFIKYEYVDQIANVINSLKNNPDDRRMLVSAWNPGLLPDTSKSFADNVAAGKQALPPCHYAFQFWVGDGALSCMLNQRSCDVFLGVPFNIVQYSILTRMIAHVCDLEPGEFIWSGGDVHLYNDHVEQARMQLQRKPSDSPKLVLNPDVKDIDSFKFEDFKIVGYDPQPAIPAKVSV